MIDFIKDVVFDSGADGGEVGRGRGSAFGSSSAGLGSSGGRGG